MERPLGYAGQHPQSLWSANLGVTQNLELHQGCRPERFRLNDRSANVVVAAEPASPPQVRTRHADQHSCAIAAFE